MADRATFLQYVLHEHSILSLFFGHPEPPPPGKLNLYARVYLFLLKLLIGLACTLFAVAQTTGKINLSKHWWLALIVAVVTPTIAEVAKGVLVRCARAEADGENVTAKAMLRAACPFLHSCLCRCCFGPCMRHLPDGPALTSRVWRRVLDGLIALAVVWTAYRLATGGAGPQKLVGAVYVWASAFVFNALALEPGTLTWTYFKLAVCCPCCLPRYDDLEEAREAEVDEDEEAPHEAYARLNTD
mmetsp:Transcript_31586/g.102960  ORF Transcript_31586/g.102960 Transcript_31586/m.102960 type:complete len:243 (+) Transcript_31586:60-788(+)